MLLDVAKIFLGLTTFDKVGLRYSFVSHVVKNSLVDTQKYYILMGVPVPKLEQNVFTVKEVRHP